MKKKWTTPKLKVLVRGKLGENVLGGCGTYTDREGNVVNVPNSPTNG